ncbi:MAG TPA: hypothetical protein VMB25_24160 [Bryobacteraceae bacterium]|nr:hypothetical protein [Bryobacteraceae bacterium]
MRKPDITRRLTWRNPLSDFTPRPYLECPVFPNARGSEPDRKASEVLARFYTSERAHGEDDGPKLRNFIRNPEKQVFVIWGDIGIGKSWFVRYQLASLMKESKGAFYYGVVDMLRASTQDARQQLEHQIIEVLEDYFKNALGGLSKGLKPYADHKASSTYTDRASDEFRAESNRILQESLALRNSERADCLLDAIEVADGPPLYIAVDNLDHAVGEDQHLLTDLVARKLHNAKIYLIFSLRASSRILLDDAKILGFFEKIEMHLSAVNFAAMLRPRFTFAKNGEDLKHITLPLTNRDGDETITFPELLQMFVESEAGEFVLDLAGTNSRKLLDFVSRVLYSNQLGGIRNIAEPESCIATLLMLDQARFDPELSYILNLFDNNEPNVPGNALIRFRVLEFLNQSGEVSLQEKRLSDYFKSLGYLPEKRIKEVIATFVGAGLAQTNPPRTADNIRESSFHQIGMISLVKNNAAQYFEKLLKSPWYFICVKSDTCVPESLIRTDQDGLEFVTDTDFVDFLKYEEDEERKRTEAWKKRYGNLVKAFTPGQPWAMARAALDKKRRVRQASGG